MVAAVVGHRPPSDTLLRQECASPPVNATTVTGLRVYDHLPSRCRNSVHRQSVSCKLQDDPVKFNVASFRVAVFPHSVVQTPPSYTAPRYLQSTPFYLWQCRRHGRHEMAERSLGVALLSPRMLSPTSLTRHVQLSRLLRSYDHTRDRPPSTALARGAALGGDASRGLYSCPRGPGLPSAPSPPAGTAPEVGPPLITV